MIFGLPQWLVVLLALFILIFILAKWRLSYFKNLKIPSPPGVPILGHFPLLFKEGFTVDSRLIQTYGKIYGMFEGLTPVLVVADPELIKQIFVKQFSSFTDRRTAGFPINQEFHHALTVLKGTEWRRVRNVINLTFSASKLKRITPQIVECAKELTECLGKLTDKGEVLELKTLCNSYTLDVIISTQFGFSVNSQKQGQTNEFLKHAQAIFKGFTLANPVLLICLFLPCLSSLFERLGFGLSDSAACQFFRQKIFGMIDMRHGQKEKPIDFLQLLLEAHNLELDTEADEAISLHDETTETNQLMKDLGISKKALSRDEVLSNALVFCAAGYETTATTMSLIFYLLALNPEVQQKLFEEIENVFDENRGQIDYNIVASMEYLDQVVCETLRLYPPAQRYFWAPIKAEFGAHIACFRADRVCTQPAMVGKYRIPKDLIIVCSIWGVHRNPEFWPQPEKFIPERFSLENKANIKPHTYMPFGNGQRNCVGMRLALLEAKIGIIHAVKALKFETCQETEIPLKLKPSRLTTPLNGVKLRATRR